jgi:hypothetical protein
MPGSLHNGSINNRIWLKGQKVAEILPEIEIRGVNGSRPCEWIFGDERPYTRLRPEYILDVLKDLVDVAQNHPEWTHWRRETEAETELHVETPEFEVPDVKFAVEPPKNRLNIWLPNAAGQTLITIESVRPAEYASPGAVFQGPQALFYEDGERPASMDMKFIGDRSVPLKPDNDTAKYWSYAAKTFVAAYAELH